MTAARLYDAPCYCKPAAVCITCARWARLYRALQARRREWNSRREQDR